MKKNIIFIIIIIVIVIFSGIGIGYLIFENRNDNIVDSNNDLNDNNINDGTNSNYIISEESIKELAKNNKYIDTSFEEKIDFEISYDEYNQINNQSLELLIENGKVYLYSDSYRAYENGEWVEKPGKEYKSLISNIKENVIMIKTTVSGACVIDALEYAILTDKGNVYITSFNDNVNNSNNILTSLSKNEDVNLSFKLLNKKGLKILAFTNYRYDDRGNTCTSYASPVYASDNTLRDYETFEIAKPIIYYTIVYEDGMGFVVYEDYTISVDNDHLIKNKDGSNLLIKEFYNDSNSDKIFIVDKNNYLYYQDEAGNIKLYNENKVKDVKKVRETESNWYDIIEFTITFENNETLEIEINYDEYKIFD